MKELKNCVIEFFELVARVSSREILEEKEWGKLSGDHSPPT